MHNGLCVSCVQKANFAAFAQACGLTCYPDPTGERYVYHLDGSCAGKKGECLHVINELWNALVAAKGAPAVLRIDD